MPFTVVSLETRKYGFDPSNFEEYYEGVHMKILKEATGSFFPNSHTRYYLKRLLEDPRNPTDPADAQTPPSSLRRQHLTANIIPLPEVIFPEPQAPSVCQPTLQVDQLEEAAELGHSRPDEPPTPPSSRVRGHASWLENTMTLITM
ncbi:hypothetical protein K491DRAFT_87478 [Lophiostoma macrostomum CBS 122681]|uniref:EthD domain-containing protein n=1 Tax=Lophiostoma macrostomum CBS 122681 TaxID=1314788 RepID=A0A6A6SV11_9PLEO|nr:hypothetical protein K491DRAFT_87478 [Lophiostoma macrostomum CBS 122681]